jgi:hypothetical protein
VFGPLPATEFGRDVVLADQVLRVADGSWNRGEGPQLANKVNIGPATYADLDPSFSSHVITNLGGGYGLRRYSDHPDREVAALMFLEASNVDTRFPDFTLAMRQTVEFLPGVTAPIVWLGEFEPSTGLGVRLVAVAGTRIAVRGADGTWTDSGITLPAAAARGAVGVFNKNLIIGFGAAAPAVRTVNLTSTAAVTDATVPLGVPIYVWAVTADQAAAYVAGGPAVTDWHIVRASTDGIHYGTPVPCGTADTKITALSPGGGVSIVHVGKEEELGSLDQAGIYRKLVPYDSRSPTNSLPQRWMLGAGGEEQRGPLVLFFKRERALWLFQPQTDTAGAAANVSPWAEPYVRPRGARGDIRALQGSARWLYAAIRNAESGNTWIAARDARNGRWHLPLDLGAYDCQAMAITSLFGTNPLLFADRGDHVVSVILPLDGDAPADDPAVRYADAGWLLLSDIDLGFPDEQKVLFSVKLDGEGFVADQQEIAIYAAYDGGPYTFLGKTADDPSCVVDLLPAPTLKRLSLRLEFATADPARSPLLHSISVRLSLNIEPRQLWEFDVLLPAGHRGDGAADLDNPHTVLGAIWAARVAGGPVVFRDRWGDFYNVRILATREHEVYRDPQQPPETVLSLQLLEVSEGAAAGAQAPLVWTSAAADPQPFIPVLVGG